MAERWLLTGGTGQVGTALRRSPPAGVQIVAPVRSAMDLSNLPDDLSLLLKGVNAIINCAAYTGVDKAESEPELSWAINAVAPGRLADAAALASIPIIHISTDYVFPANGVGPWREDDPTGPVSAYGKTKLAGEEAVRCSGARHAIIRTAWVVSADGNNFAKTMLRAGAQNEVVRVVDDQRGSPTHAGDLANAIGIIANRFTRDPEQPSGTWHCANAGETSWHGLALYIFACAEARGLRVPYQVPAIATGDYPTLAPRPADSRLDCSRAARDFGISLRHWKDAVKEIITILGEGATLA